MARDHRFDNIKVLLIFLVVFGHLLELIADKTFSHDLYLVIYSFHMPAFVFVSGYFARWSPKKILTRLAWVYILFQVVYILFDNALFGNSSPIQFFTPYWLMWYMLVMVYCYCLIPFIDTASAPKRAIILGLAVAVSLLAGFDDNVGRFMSLSRLFTFLPYFIAGFYMGKSRDSLAKLEEKLGRRKPLAVVVALIAVVIAAVFVLSCDAITPNVLFGASSYAAAGYGPLLKGALLLVATAFIALLLLATPNRRIPFVTAVGAGTLSIYILHGFIVRALSITGLFCFSEVDNLVLALLLSVVMVLALGCKPVAKFFSSYCTGKWVERIL